MSLWMISACILIWNKHYSPLSAEGDIVRQWGGISICLTHGHADHTTDLNRHVVA